MPDPTDHAHVDDDLEVAEVLQASNPDSPGPGRGAGDQEGSGLRDTRTAEASGDDESGKESDGRSDGRSEGAPPEQTAGGAEENPEGLTPKAGYPSRDPRSD